MLPLEDDLHKKKEKSSTQHNWQANFLIFDIWMFWYLTNKEMTNICEHWYLDCDT